MLGSGDVGREFGAVSALTFNREADRLLVGFARGQVSALRRLALFAVSCIVLLFFVVVMQMTMWNLVDGKLLRTITDAHPPGSAILSLKVLTPESIYFKYSC